MRPEYRVPAPTEPIRDSSFQITCLISEGLVLLERLLLVEDRTNAHHLEDAVRANYARAPQLFPECIAFRIRAWIQMLSDALEGRRRVWRRIIARAPNVDMVRSFPCDTPDVEPE